MTPNAPALKRSTTSAQAAAADARPRLTQARLQDTVAEGVDALELYVCKRLPHRDHSNFIRPKSVVEKDRGRRREIGQDEG
jgi:hypothetical protein